jgi:hypothetical protein
VRWLLGSLTVGAVVIEGVAPYITVGFQDLALDRCCSIRLRAGVVNGNDSADSGYIRTSTVCWGTVVEEATAVDVDCEDRRRDRK